MRTDAGAAESAVLKSARRWISLAAAALVGTAGGACSEDAAAPARRCRLTCPPPSKEPILVNPQPRSRRCRASSA
ncbi:MAG: hypothetical protein R3F11_01275 [Verrucomicrobiales bacterium]